MPTKLTYQLNSVPSPVPTFFTLFVDYGTPEFFTISVNYKNTAPTGPYDINVTGKTVNQIIAETLVVFQSFTTPSYVSFSSVGNKIEIVIDPEDDFYGNTDVDDLGDSSLVYKLTQIYYENDPVITGSDVVKHVIEIFDTYTNTRTLVEDYTDDSYASLKFDGGDDLYGQLISSNLAFNMLVGDAADGKYLHLFTGDEKRYLVKVRELREDNSESLLWKGYLLPDLYKEPYINGAFFVDFAATDMVGVLKNHFMKPWEYNNTLPVIEVIGMCLEKAGLYQNIVVRPSLISAVEDRFEYYNMNLAVYFEDGKATNCYEILMDILKAMMLTLVSFRGQWILTGLSRKFELSGVERVYNYAGKFLKQRTYSKNHKQPLYARETPMVSIDTPFKSVAVEIEAKTTSNAMPEAIVQVENPFCTYRLRDLDLYNPGFMSAPDLQFGYEFNGYWQKVGNPFWRFWEVVNPPDQRLNFSYTFDNPFPSSQYDVSESYALNNYFKANGPYLCESVRYELEMEVEVSLNVMAGTMDDLAGFNHLVDFQIFVDGVEIISNRPSFPDGPVWWFEKENAGPIGGSSYKVLFKIKKEFKTNHNGWSEVRFLCPIYSASYWGVFGTNTRVTKLRINVLESPDLSVSAVRDIEFTKSFEEELKLFCSVDSSVKNSFGIGRPFENYFYNVPYYDEMDFTGSHVIGTNPAGVPIVYNMHFKTFQVDPFIFDLVMKTGLKKNLFAVKIDGTEVSYPFMYGRKKSGYYRLAYCHDIVGFPNKYKELVPAEVLSPLDKFKLMAVFYAPEEIVNRKDWRVYGYSGDDSFVKTYAKAVHMTKPRPVYKIETTVLDVVVPDDVLMFKYLGIRNYIPSTMNINLVSCKTDVVMTESVFEPLTDIDYES